MFSQTKGLCSSMLCGIIEDLSSLEKFNWALSVRSFLVGYVRKITYLANVMVGGEKATTGNLCDASLILQVKLYDYTIEYKPLFYI